MKLQVNVFVILFLGLVILGLAFYAISLQRRFDSLQRSILELTKERLELESKLEEIGRELKVMSNLRNVEKHEEAEGEGLLKQRPSIQDQFFSHEPSQTNSLLSEKKASWRTKQFISDIERLIALDDQQRASIEAKFQEIAVKAEPPSENDRYVVIADVLGPEMLERFKKAEGERITKDMKLLIERETAILSRRLSLSSELEILLSNSIERAENIMQPMRMKQRSLMREAMANHFGGEDAKQFLKEQYNLIKDLSEEIKNERNRVIFDTLSEHLNDEQLNDLLQYQLESSP